MSIGHKHKLLDSTSQPEARGSALKSAMGALKAGMRIVSMAPRRRLICTEKEHHYVIWHIGQDGTWEKRDSFFDYSGNDTDALLNFMLGANGREDL